jgi:hypothetical protein
VLIANFHADPNDPRDPAHVAAARAEVVAGNAAQYGEGTFYRAHLDGQAKELHRIAFMERARAGEKARG